MDAIYTSIQSMIVRGLVLCPDLGVTLVTITASIVTSFVTDGDQGILGFNVEPRNLVAAGGFKSFDINTPVGQHQIYNPGDFWDSLRLSLDQPTLHLTIQRKKAQSAISLQNPLLPEAVP
jgi:type II secretory pathway component PulC